MRKEHTIDWLFVLPDDLIGGGAQQVLFTLINHLITEGNNCTVVFTVKKKHRGWEILEDKCNIVYLNHNSVYRGYFGTFNYIRKLSKTHHITYAISSQALINGLLGLLKKLNILKNTTLILRESTSVFLRFKGLKLRLYKTAYKIGYNEADLIICQTELMKTQLLDALSWLKNHNNIEVIPNPVSLDEIQKKANETIDFEIDNYIVAAGRLIPEKGFDILIRSFNDLSDKNLKLVILGVGSEMETESMNRLIASLDLQERVILYGYVKNVYPIFRNAQACVVSSRIEGFPNVLLQMMSQNNKVVSTLCAGEISEIEGLYTCETHNANALTTAIESCLKSNKDNYELHFKDYIASRSIDNFVKLLHNKIS